MRPKGSKDTKPRKKKTFWTKEDTVFLKRNWDKMSTKEIAKVMNKSEACIRQNANNFSSLRSKNFMVDIIRVIDASKDEKISGVYGIVTYDNRKVYIGSSYDIIPRLNFHLENIRRGSHSSNVLSKLDPSQLFFVLFSECEEQLLMECEARLIRKYSPYVLLNQHIPQDLGEMKDFLDQAIKNGNLEKYNILDNGCWEWSARINSSGYGSLQVSIDKVRKFILAHRLMYYSKTGEYPNLIRHMCHNRICINPDHLQSGSSRENALDTTQVLYDEFEKKYIEFKGDKIALTEYFGWRPNYNGKYSAQVVTHMRKLGLRKKYPEFLPEKSKSRKRKPSAKKTKSLMVGRRGPKRKRYIGEIVACWKCVEEYVEGKKHRWVCMECGRRRLSKKSNISSMFGCRTCRTYPIPNSGYYEPSETSYINTCGHSL